MVNLHTHTWLCGHAVGNADAHVPELVDAYLDKGYALAEKMGVEVVYPVGQ